MKKLNGNVFLNKITLVLLIITSLIAIFSGQFLLHALPAQALISFSIWIFLAIVTACLMRNNFVPYFLISLFCMMIAWRISGIYDLYRISIPLLFAFMIYFANFIYCAKSNLENPSDYIHAISKVEWQLIFIRLYIGLNFIPHFTEKLFAGSAPRMEDVNAFIQLGVHPAFLFVIFAGLCEFGSAIAIALGFMQRIGSLGAVLYLLIATYLGHHFLLGFIWAGKGGGWEFAVMWSVLILSFAVVGKHAFTIDEYLEDHFNIPKFIKKLM